MDVIEKQLEIICRNKWRKLFFIKTEKRKKELEKQKKFRQKKLMDRLVVIMQKEYEKQSKNMEDE